MSSSHLSEALRTRCQARACFQRLGYTWKSPQVQSLLRAYGVKHHRALELWQLKKLILELTFETAQEVTSDD